MKKMIFLMLFGIMGMCLQAQTVNIHKKDGTVIKIALQDFDYINISETGSSSSKQSAVSSSNKIDGVYKTDYREMILTQTGNKVNGTYGGTYGRIEGTLNGRTLTGRWYQSNGQGRILFEFNSDFSAFTGKWSYNDAQPTAQWNGTRIR